MFIYQLLKTNDQPDAPMQVAFYAEPSYHLNAIVALLSRGYADVLKLLLADHMAHHQEHHANVDEKCDFEQSVLELLALMQKRKFIDKPMPPNIVDSITRKAGDTE